MITREQIGSLTLYQDSEEFRLGRDTLLLAEFVRLRSGMRVCDLGCGVGNLLVALAARQPDLRLDGVEIRPNAADLCRRSLAENGLAGGVVTGSLTEFRPELPRGGYDLVVANPPYFPAGSGKTAPDPGRAAARTEGDFTLRSACAAAARLCKNGGRFALCLPPTRLAELFVWLRDFHLEPKRLQLVQSAPDREANLALTEAKKGGNPGLQVLPTRIER